MADQTLNILLNPTIDIAKFNAIVNTIKSSFTNFNPIDGAKLASSLSAIKPNIVGIATEANSFAAGLVKSDNAAKGLANSGTLASKAFNFSNMVNSVNIISSAFGQVAQAGIDFESNLAAVSAITGFTGAKLDVLGISARSLAKEFGGSATDQLKSFQGILSKLGPEMASDSEALATYAKNVNILSQASGDDAATSMSALTDSLLQMGLASGTPAQIANESTKAINILAASAQVGAAEIPQVSQSLLAAGVAAKGANLSLVDVNAAIQVLAVGGKTGSEAGNALRNVLGLMQKASGPAEAAMKKLGTSSKELGSILTTQGLDVAMAKLQVGMKGLGTDAERNAALIEIFGQENSAAAGIMIDNTDKFAEFKKGIQDGMGGIGSAFEQAGTRMNTAGTLVSIAQSYISDAFIGISQSAGQGITALVGASAQFAPLIASFSGLSQLVPDGMFSNMINSAKTLGTTILSTLVPGLVSQDIATKSIVFNTEALTLANVKQMVVSKAKLALDYLQSTAIYGLVTGQLSLNAAMLANPIGAVVIGATALIGALYLLYDNVESVRNIFDGAWSIIKIGASAVWTVIKDIGSAVYEVGGVIVSLLVAPFQVAWSVISGVGSAIGSIVGSIFGIADGGNLVQTAINGISQAVQVVTGVIDNVRAVVAGVTGTIESLIGSITTGIGQLFSLDFGGLYDTVMGAGDKAGQAFNDSFNTKMRGLKFDDAKQAIEDGLKNAGEVNIKVKAQTDFNTTLAEYQKVQQQIADLSAKKTSGIISESDAKELDNLKAKAVGYATEIQKIAPETVSGFKSIVDANGNITNSYDININKALEFAKANNFSSELEAQKQSVSKNVSTMASTYAQQTYAVKKLQEQIAKGTDNKEEYDKLTTSFKDAKAKAEEMKNAMVDNFVKAGKAGVLTEDAINKVAFSLGKTNAEAKDMLLKKELEGAANQSRLTTTQVTELAAKYGLSGDQVTRIFNEQKKVTAEIEKSKLATEGWGDAQSRIKGISDEAIKAAKNAEYQLKTNKSLTAADKERLQVIIDTSKQKLTDARKDAVALVEVDKKIKTEKAYAAVVTEYTEKQTKAANNAKSKTEELYELEKKRLDGLEKNFKLSETDFINTQEKYRLENKITVTEKQKNIDKVAAIQRELEFNKTNLDNYNALIALANELPEKDGKIAAALDVINTKIKEIKTSSDTLGLQSAQINADINVNDEKFKADLLNIQSDSKRIQIEADVKLGLADQTALDIFDLEKLKSDKVTILKEISDLQTKIRINEDKGYDTSALESNLATKQQLIIKNDTETSIKQRDLNSSLELQRINQIADNAERERQLKIFEAQKTYNEELRLAQNNQSLILIAQMKFNDSRNKSDQDYLSKTSMTYNLLSNLTKSFANAKYDNQVDNSKVADLTKTKSDLAKEKSEIQNSYNSGKTDFDSYQKSLSDLQQKESDNRVALEQAEAEKKKAIWAGFTTAVSGYLSTMYDEYSKKSAENINTILATESNSVAIKKKIADNEANYKQAQIDGDLTAITAATNKRTELENEETKNKAENSKAVSALYVNLGVSAGMMFGQMIADNQSFGKSVIKTALSVVKALVPILSAQILGYSLATPDAIATLGASAIIKYTVLTGLLYGAVGLAESAVSGAFKDGIVNFQGKGNGTSDSNLVRISHGESVLTNKATSNPLNQRFFNFANKTGGDFIDFMNVDKELQKQLAVRNDFDYFNDLEKRKLYLDNKIEENRNERVNMQKVINELVKSNKELGDRLEKVINNTTLVETRHAYNINATNNIINNVATADIFGRA